MGTADFQVLLNPSLRFGYGRQTLSVRAGEHGDTPAAQEAER